MIKTTGFRIAVVAIAVFLSALGIAAYKAYAIFYNQILEPSQTWHLRVDEISGTSPLQIRITTDPYLSGEVVRKVTISRRGDGLTVLYHLAIAGLAKPGLNWGEAYTLTVPDSVNKVRFGHDGKIIWHRSRPAK